MKKFLLLITVFCFVFHGSFSQIIVEYSGDRKLLAEGGVHPTKIDYPRIQLPEFDFTSLQEKSMKWEPNVPFQFGKAFNMNLSLSDGKWYDSPNGKIWKLGISSKGSHSINLNFSKLHLANGASMYIYNDDRDMLMGPFTNNNTNSAVGEFITDLVKGSSITIELFEPSREPTSEMVISKVIHGYVNTFSSGFGQSEPCNIDIDCPVGQPFEIESNAISRLLVANGTGFCSGALVNNSCADFTPYLLTANHCLVGNPGAFVFRFQFRSPTPRCDGLGGGGNSLVNIFYNGSQIVANQAATDFGLLQMNIRPSHENASMLGWSRNIGGIPGTAGIHHPRGDLMKIAIDNNVPQIFPGNFLGTPPNSHWGVNFDIGTVEPNSSGSPLLDQNNRIIGQLHGGTARDQFGNPINRCNVRDGFYGRFDLSWGRDQTGNFLPGRNAANSLAPWLDPNNTGAMTTNTIAIPSLSGPSILCTSETYTVSNVAPGTTVTWSALPSGAVSFTGSGNSRTVTRQGGYMGEVSLTASTTTACGVSPFSKNILVGGIPQNSLAIQGDDQVCYGNYTYFVNNNSNFPILEYQWQLPAGWNATWQNGNYLYVDIPPYEFFPQTIEVLIRTECGWQGPLYFEVWEKFPGCSNPTSPFVVYPNPADSRLMVSLDLEGQRSDAQVKTTSFSVVIYDEKGRLCLTGESIDGQAVLLTEHLPEGPYYLHIDYNGKEERRQIRIRR